MSERSSFFYNKMYRSGGSNEQYFKNPEDSVYFPLWDEMIKRIKPEAKLVDFGCGPGQFAFLAFQRNINYVLGVDFSRTAIKMAKLLNPDHKDVFIKENLYKKDIYTRVPYDTCIFSEVLEHIEGDTEILSYVPKGIHTLISLPSFPSKSHVRHFSSIDEISERYKNHLEINEIKLVITLPSTGNKIYLLDGIIK